MTTTVNITGMDCAHCAATVEKGVAQLPGVRAVRVDFMAGRLVFEGEVAPETLRQRVESLGYGIGAEEKTYVAPKRGGVIGFWQYLTERSETRLALIGGALLIIGGLLNLPLVLIAATLIAGYPIIRSGLQTLLINRDININLLMSIAAIGAIVIDETLEAATVIFLFAIGEALEGYTADRARDSIRSLMSLAPAEATRLTELPKFQADSSLMMMGEPHPLPPPHTQGGELEEVVSVEALKVDDLILIKAGERIPMDGVITGGSSEVNQAPITGESLPISKTAGAEVFAGTINGSGLLKVRVTRLAADNTLSRIIKLVEEAQSVRAPSQRLIDQFARVYTPAVVAIAFVIATVPPLLFNAPFFDTGDTRGWLYRALALLVIACPCALVISAPVTVISGIANAARRGVLIKGGAHLEALGAIRAFAFDKTGTLTHGQPTVITQRAVDCQIADDDCERCEEVLALASALEKRSSHPLAKAIVHSAQARGLAVAPAEAVETMAGQGVRGLVQDRQVTLGSHRFFDEQYPHSDAFCDMVKAAEARGQTTVLVQAGDQVRGYIALADAVREDSAAVVREIKGLGGITAMLTGDNATVAQQVGAQVGVDEVRASLLPSDKVAAVQDLKVRYQSVAMIGDGINDTPALAAATLGIAMGGAGSPQALETADIALMADDLKQLPFAVRLGRAARQRIRQNVLVSFGIKFIFLALAVGGVTSLWLAILADVGTSLLVTLNGMRLLKFR